MRGETFRLIENKLTTTFKKRQQNTEKQQYTRNNIENYRLKKKTRTQPKTVGNIRCSGTFNLSDVL